jgi:hypothetical protein
MMMILMTTMMMMMKTTMNDFMMRMKMMMKIKMMDLYDDHDDLYTDLLPGLLPGVSLQRAVVAHGSVVLVLPDSCTQVRIPLLHCVLLDTYTLKLSLNNGLVTDICTVL